MATDKVTALIGRIQVRNGSDSAHLPRLTGRAYMPANDCSYAAAIDTEDLLQVDFDIDKFMGCGLYLIEKIKGDRCVWRGCKRFAQAPSGVQIDWDGRGDWVSVPPDLRIVGRVEQVYRLQKTLNRMQASQ